MQFRTSTYHALVCRIQSIADDVCEGKLVFCLEGGYDLEGLSTSVADSFRGLLNWKSKDKYDPVFLRPEPLDRVSQIVKEVRRIHEL